MIKYKNEFNHNSEISEEEVYPNWNFAKNVQI